MSCDLTRVLNIAASPLPPIGPSITAAWLLPGKGFAKSYQLPGPSAIERTVVRGEMAAIHAALHSRLIPRHVPLHILTDSLTSLQIIAGYLGRPFEFRDHKHRWLAASIAHCILARPGHVTLGKVRAHAGISGNVAVDALAKQAHEMPNAPLFTFADPIARGPAWIQYRFGESNSDVQNLHDHTLTLAKAAAVQQLHSRADRNKSQTYLRFAAVRQGMAIHDHASNAFWEASCIIPFMIALALKIRTYTFPTRSRLAQWYPNRGLPTTCPACEQVEDTLGHRLGACTVRSIANQRCARHGHAVNAIAQEVKTGQLGNCIMYVDAECHQPRYKSFHPAILPIDLQTSRPDIVVVQGLQGDPASLRGGRHRDPRYTVHLVEVTFTSDTRVHDRVESKAAQHAQLCRDFRAYGWVDIRLHIFIMGHTGMTRMHNAEILLALGVVQPRINVCLKSLAIMALQRSVGIMTSFPDCGRGPSAQVAYDQEADEDGTLPPVGGSSTSPPTRGQPKRRAAAKRPAPAQFAGIARHKRPRCSTQDGHVTQSSALSTRDPTSAIAGPILAPPKSPCLQRTTLSPATVSTALASDSPMLSGLPHAQVIMSHAESTQRQARLVGCKRTRQLDSSPTPTRTANQTQPPDEALTVTQAELDTGLHFSQQGVRRSPRLQQKRSRRAGPLLVTQRSSRVDSVKEGATPAARGSHASQGQQPRLTWDPGD